MVLVPYLFLTSVRHYKASPFIVRQTTAAMLLSKWCFWRLLLSLACRKIATVAAWIGPTKQHALFRREVVPPPPAALAATRRRFLLTGGTTTTVAIILPPPAQAFDGGIGGLGKTRPETGVVLVGPPTQTSSGLVSAELLLDERTGDVALVSFQTPWPLLTTSTGLEARDLATSDAAFCHVVPGTLWRPASSSPKAAAKGLQQVLQTTVLATQGKFGMYGPVTEVKVKPVLDEPSLYTLSFTTLTPGMRESDRKYYVAVQTVQQTLVLLLVGTTANRFGSQEGILRRVAQSWQVVSAPPKATRR